MDLLLGELLNLEVSGSTSGHQISGVSDDPSFEQMTVGSVKTPALLNPCRVSSSLRSTEAAQRLKVDSPQADLGEKLKP